MSVPLGESPSALDDLRVLDLTGPMGVYATKLMAELGADVIRVEPPQGDAARRLGPFYEDEPGVERSLFHWHFNTSKRGVTLDITKSDGQEIFRRLAKSADVVVETFQPGYLDGLGLGLDQLSRVNPGIILASITPFGQQGPYRDFAGEELIGQAAGGLLQNCGWPDRPPVMMGGWPAMHQASAQAVAGTLLALEYRDQTGEGQQVDVSVQACLPLTLMVSMPEYFATGKMRQPRVGDGHPSALNGMFQVRDGYIDIRFRGRPTQWEQLISWMDSKGMAGDLGEERWADPEHRRDAENARHIDELFQKFIMEFDREDAMDLCQRNAVEAGAVYTAEDLLRDPQLQARNYFVDVEHPDLGRSFTYPGGPYTLMETPWRLTRRAPLLGEHNLEIYEGDLGLSREEIASLVARGVI